MGGIDIPLSLSHILLRATRGVGGCGLLSEEFPCKGMLKQMCSLQLDMQKCKF